MMWLRRNKENLRLELEDARKDVSGLLRRVSDLEGKSSWRSVNEFRRQPADVCPICGAGVTGRDVKTEGERKESLVCDGISFSALSPGTTFDRKTTTTHYACGAARVVQIEHAIGERYNHSAMYLAGPCLKLKKKP